MSASYGQCGSVLYGQCTRCGGPLTLGHRCFPEPISEEVADRIREVVRQGLNITTLPMTDYEVSG